MTGSHNGILTVSVERLIGPPHIANLVLSVFFGVTIVQVHVYVKHMKRDNVFMRYLILLVWALNAFHFFLVSSTHYYYVIENFGHAALLRCTTWRASALVFVTAASDLVVRGIFTYRLWKFSQNNITLVTFLCIGCLLNFGTSITFASRIVPLRFIRQFDIYSWLIYLAMGSAAAADVAIAVTQFVLLKCHGKSGSSQSRSVLRSLMIYSINTGALTSICAICCLVSYATMRSNYVYDAFYWMLPTLYFNALLATLNARKRLRESLEGQVISLPTIVISAPTIPPSVAAPAWHESFRHEIAEVPRVLPRQRPLSSFSLKFIDAAMDAIALAELGKGVSSPMLSGHVPSSTAFYNL